MSKMAELAADVERANRLSEGPKFDDGGPAFPNPGYELHQEEGRHGQLAAHNLYKGPPAPGMTLRAHFAGLAMQGVLANGVNIRTPHERLPLPESIAAFAVDVADALIAALKK